MKTKNLRIAGYSCLAVFSPLIGYYVAMWTVPFVGGFFGLLVFIAGIVGFVSTAVLE